jgi:integrase
MTRRRGPGEGSITPRADGRFQVRVDVGRDPVTGKRQRIYRYAPDRKAAVGLLQQLQRDKEAGKLGPSNKDLPQTLSGWLDLWLESVKVHREPLTYERYEAVCRVHLKPALGHKRVTQITPLDVQRLLDGKMATRSSNTVRTIAIVLEAALSRAQKMGLVAHNVASGRRIEQPRAQRAPENILGLEEARTFLDGIRGDRLHALFLTAAVLGQRQSSLLGLRWQDVDLEYQTARWPMKLIRVKGSWQLRPAGSSRTKRAPRKLPLPAPVAAALRQHRANQEREREIARGGWLDLVVDGREVDLVFTMPDGRPIYGSWATEQFQRRLAEAGLERRRFHDLRHSAASIMIALGIPLKVVSEVLAHTGIQITADLYGHLEDDMLREQLRVLDTAWAAS